MTRSIDTTNIFVGSRAFDPRAALAKDTFTGRLLRRKLAVAALIIIIVIVVLCMFAQWTAPYGANEADLSNSYAGPSWEHWLGTDALGRDIYSRILWGGQVTLPYSLVPFASTLVVGVGLGLLAGFAGGWIDRTIGWFVDVGLSLPSLPVLMIVLAIFRDYFLVALVFVGILTAPPLVRVIRSSALSVRREPYVDAARVAGRSGGYILSRHILPRIRGTILVQMTLMAAGGLMMLTGLSYLGYGPQPPIPTWGGMITEAQSSLGLSPWLLISAGGITALMTLSLGVLGDAVRDAAVEGWAGAPAAPERRRRVAATADRARTDAVPAAGDALLQVAGLTVAYERNGEQTVVVDGVGFSIAAGESLALVGESGCGKSSVGNALLGLLGPSGKVTAGTVAWQGREILGEGVDHLRDLRGSSIGFVSQEPMAALDPSFRVGSQLAEAVRHSAPGGTRLSRAQVRERVRELLTLVRLPDPAAVEKMYPHELSGGMAQRVCIARAIAGRPKLLIADEPTTALDVTVQAEILDLFRSLQEEIGMALLLVTHDWGVVARVCRRTLVMYAGQVVEEAPLRSLLQQPGHPYSAALLGCRPDPTTNAATALPAIGGVVPEPENWTEACRFAARCPLAVDACTEAPVALELVDAQHARRCIRPLELISAAQVLTTGRNV